MDITRREKLGLIIFLLIMIFITSAFYFSNKSKNEIIVNSKSSSNSDDKKSSDNLIKVYIYGEINKPGVYTLKNGDRIEELISAAGGFTPNAELSQINLASKLKDEDFIKIPGKNLQNSLGAVSSQQANIENGKININFADLETLKELPRIGDTIAKRIIEYREKNGSFKDIKDITNVSGIGEKMFEEIKDKITVH